MAKSIEIGTFYVKFKKKIQLLNFHESNNPRSNTILYQKKKSFLISRQGKTRGVEIN
jgi:hypothetical protein